MAAAGVARWRDGAGARREVGPRGGVARRPKQAVTAISGEVGGVAGGKTMTNSFDIGSRFGRLVVLGRQPKQRGVRRRKFILLCDCGKTIEALRYNLLSGNTRSCGCLHIDAITKHGEFKTPLYRTWQNVVGRCQNKNSKYYGARGISMHPEWAASYEAFRDTAGVGWAPGLQIDRVDNDKGYEPGNVRWVTPAQNVRNRRVTTKIETPEGVLPLAEVAARAGVPLCIARWRYNAGWAYKDIINPERQTKKSRR